MGRCRVKKKNKKKRQRRERERERDTDTFFFSSIGRERLHKGCRHTCTYERGVRLPVEKKGDRAN